MPKEYGRNARVADLIQRELAGLMERDRMDNSSALVTISNVDVSPDLKNAKVFVTCLDSESNKELLAELKENAGHYRHHLSKQLNMRGVPKLSFVYDHALEKANRLTAIIDTLSNEDSNKD